MWNDFTRKFPTELALSSKLFFTINRVTEKKDLVNCNTVTRRVIDSLLNS